jgi:hypothetical protein
MLVGPSRENIVLVMRPASEVTACDLAKKRLRAAMKKNIFESSAKSTVAVSADSIPEFAEASEFAQTAREPVFAAALEHTAAIAQSRRPSINATGHVRLGGDALCEVISLGFDRDSAE